MRSRIMPPARVSSLTAGRIALGYAVIALLWIAVGDAFVRNFNLSAAMMTIKGTVFVLVTASLLYFITRRLVQDVQITSSKRKRTEDALRQSEAYLTEAQALSHSGSFAFDVASDKYLYISEECFRIFELDPQQGSPTREAVSRLIHREDWGTVEADFEKLLRDKIDTSTDFRVTLPSGTTKYLHAIRHPVLNVAGNVVQVVGTAIDITERRRAEEERHQSAERFRAIADYTYDWENWFGVDGKLLWVNPAVERITGYSVDECMAMPDFPMPVVAESDRQLVASGVREAVQGSSRNDVEFRVRHKDGHLAWVAASWQPICDSEGARLGYRVSIRDIAERKRAEEALRRSEAYLADAERLSHTGSWALDLASDKYVYFSEECFRIFEVDTHEYPTREAVSLLICPEDRERVRAEHEKLFAEKVDAPSEFRIVLPSGAIKHIQAIRHPVLNNAGEVVSIVGSVVDITERKLAEEALRESDTRFRTFVDHAADAFFMLDFEQKKIVDVNRTACESLGYTREELIGMTPLAFDVTFDRATLESIVERAAPGDTVLLDRHWHRRKDGSTFPVEIHAIVFWHGGRRFLLKVARDITDRVYAEEQREKLRQLEADLVHMDRVSMLGELSASLAHELNQPITGVITSADACLRWLGREPPDLERARAATIRVKKDGTRASDIINHLRAFYKKGAPPQREPVDVAEIVNEMVFLLHNQASRHSVMIHTDIDAELPRIVADRVQVQQVFMNLMLNAIEAMTKTGGELTISARLSDDRMLRASISDTGVGLPTADPDQVFKAFFTTKPQGSGMGLAITRSIVEAHGGRLWASNNAVRGATFYFTLPADAGAMDEQSAVADGIRH